MMGHREKLKNAGEWDALTKGKANYHWKAGTRKLIKAWANRRARKAPIDA